MARRAARGANAWASPICARASRYRAHHGAYFASALAEARAQGRITKVAADPLLPIRLFWDIGGAGAKADACAIWVCQFVSQEIRVLDYIEGQGQVLGYYTNELRHRGYQKAVCYLPHDGLNANAITGLKYADHLRDAGFSVDVVANQGAGAAAQRIEAVRRLFRRSGSTKPPLSQAEMRLAITTSARTKTETLDWDQSTIGHRMQRMRSA